LPAALHFLLHQFTSDQIHPLLTIQSYMSFVTMYMLGSALLFQLPLILVLINRIKPLKPKKLFGYERWVILLAFVGGGIMNPSPRVQDQLMLAVPMIAAYQVGILLVWLANRRRRGEKVEALLQKDAELRAQRRAQFEAAQAALQQKLAVAGTPAAKPVVARAGAVSAKPIKPVPVALAAPAGAHAPRPHTARPAASGTTPARTAPRPVARRYFNDFTRRPSPSHPQLQQDTPEAA
jgi:hypothetical protein